MFIISTSSSTTIANSSNNIKRNCSRRRRSRYHFMGSRFAIWVFLLIGSYYSSSVIMFGLADDNNDDDDNQSVVMTSSSMIPEEFDSPFGSYPDVLGITPEMRSSFDTVVYQYPSRTKFCTSKASDNDDDDDVQCFHKRRVKVNDNRHADGLATLKEINDVKSRPKLYHLLKRSFVIRRMIRPTIYMVNSSFRKMIMTIRSINNKEDNHPPPPRPLYDIGKYDENRVSMYTSDHFLKDAVSTTNNDDSDSGMEQEGNSKEEQHNHNSNNNNNATDLQIDQLRTVHLGIDLGGPVGTPCYAFESGIVHSVGYNPSHGDYGYVIIVEHSLSLLPQGDDSLTTTTYSSNNATTTTVSSSDSKNSIKIWALYGHLDESVLWSHKNRRQQRGKGQDQHQRHKKKKKRQPGSTIHKGELVGRIGDVHVNGGWKHPHVHFQISVRPPPDHIQHDMPGACTVGNRQEALLQYPDPRYILGEIY